MNADNAMGHVYKQTSGFEQVCTADRRDRRICNIVNKRRTRLLLA
jgi:hypothetical protein